MPAATRSFATRTDGKLTLQCTHQPGRCSKSAGTLLEKFEFPILPGDPHLMRGGARSCPVSMSAATLY